MKYDITLQTIAWLHARRLDGSLIISPKFQRRPVWLAAERSALMVTILEKLPFPEIYVHHETDPTDGSEQHVVVDGQQRVTSILKFIDGEVALPDEHPWNGRPFTKLETDDKTIFWNYKVVVRSLSETNDAEIRELFQRLNTNNFALNDQELRNAKHKGVFKSLAERMADNPLFGNLGLFTSREVRRMLDVEFISELLVINLEGVTNKKDLLDDIYATYEEELPRESEIEDEFTCSISLIRSILTEDNKALIKRKSNFYSLYGAALRYYRLTHRTSFNRCAMLQHQITMLMEAARTGEIRNRPSIFQAYHEAASRAASDKSRRVEREKILYGIIMNAESSQPEEGGFDD